MFCYKDQSFCDSDCVNTECFRNKRTIPDDIDVPICMGNFRTDCDQYKEPEETTDA